MRKGFILAVLLAFIALPMAFAGTGFCRAMPCCAPHAKAQHDSIQQPDCCNSQSCDALPAAAGEFTTAKRMHQPALKVAPAAVAVIPMMLMAGSLVVRAKSSPPLEPGSLRRRIAFLSTLLI